MTRLHLIRHGESEWNAARRLQGQADPPLSARGEAQSRALGAYLAPLAPRLVAASDLQRARRTAELIGLSAAPDPAWREIDVGAWTGRATAELRTAHPELWMAWRAGEHTPEGGEPWPAFAARVVNATNRLCADEGVVAVITHGGVVRALVAQALGISPGRLAPVQPASLTVLDWGVHPRLRGYDLGPVWSAHAAPD